MEILSTIWQVIQILLLIAVVISAIAMLTAILHPLRFDLKLRGSVKGQRAEVWFVYLFRLFKIGVIATPHTQDVVVSFMGWKKRLDRSGRKNAAKTTPSAPPPETPLSPVTGSAATQSPASSASASEKSDTDMAEKPLVKPGESPGEKDTEAEAHNVEGARQTADTTPPVHPKEASAATPGKAASEVPPVLEEPEKPSETAVIDSPAQTAHAETTATAATESIAGSHEEPETIEPLPAEPVTTSPEIDSRPLKPISEVEAEYKAAKEAGSEEGSPQKGQSRSSESLKQMLRRFKRDASRRFNQFKTYARLFRLKWRALSPVLKRFWQRGKRGFGLPRIDLLLRYALHEPYLTGMCHGTLAVASGMAGQFGINFVPVPQFGSPMLYSRACITAEIRPWRLLYATGALLFERQLYKELWQLFKWYRAKKQL